MTTMTVKATTKATTKKAVHKADSITVFEIWIGNDKGPTTRMFGKHEADAWAGEWNRVSPSPEKAIIKRRRYVPAE
jgi:hypothetical protein